MIRASRHTQNTTPKNPFHVYTLIHLCHTSSISPSSRVYPTNNPLLCKETHYRTRLSLSLRRRRRRFLAALHCFLPRRSLAPYRRRFLRYQRRRLRLRSLTLFYFPRFSSFSSFSGFHGFVDLFKAYNAHFLPFPRVKPSSSVTSTTFFT